MGNNAANERKTGRANMTNFIYFDKDQWYGHTYDSDKNRYYFDAYGSDNESSVSITLMNMVSVDKSYKGE